MNGVTRKMFYGAILVLIGVALWSGKADFLSGAANYIGGLLVPQGGEIAAVPPARRTQPAQASPQNEYLPPPADRPPAEIVNPPFAAAQKYEAQGDLTAATIAYGSAMNFRGGVGPYGEDVLVGMTRVFIKQNALDAACATLKILATKFPNTRSDLLAQTTLVRHQANCPS